MLTALLADASGYGRIVRDASQRVVAIVEDDAYGFLAEDAPQPIANFAPEMTAFVTGMSKSVAAGPPCTSPSGNPQPCSPETPC